MPAYTVTQVSDQVRDWNSQKGGPMKAYRVTLRNQEGRELGNVEWSRKATSPKPEVGQSIEGEVDTKAEYGPKFKAAAKGNYGAGVRMDSPETRRSIAMQHAQKCAVSALEVAAAHGDYTPPNAADVAQHVTTIAATLFEQVQKAEAGT